MKWLRRFRDAAQRTKQEVRTYQLVLQDPRTPRPAKWLLGFALTYLLSPIDLIPDMIPIIGHLDDLIIVPGLVALALQMIPRDVVEDCRQRARAQTPIAPRSDPKGGPS